MNSGIKITFLAMAAGLSVLVCTCQGKIGSQGRYFPHRDAPRPPKVTEEEAVAQIRDDFVAKPGFSSHLPLIVIDTMGAPILPSHSWDPQRMAIVPIPGRRLFERAEMTVIDRGNGENRLTDPPVLSSSVRIRLGGDPAVENKKGYYTFTFVDRTGVETERSLLGMDSGSDWVLMGSTRDKSLIRNYIAYCLAAEIMPETPNSLFCEVFFRREDAYVYQGVFLLTESVLQGVKRTNFSLGNERDRPQGFVLLRDREDPEQVMLDTWSSRENKINGRLSLVYPKDNVSMRAVTHIEESIDKVEKIIYSDDSKEFIKYPEVIDMRSFVDYYVLNEFLQNYYAGSRSTYIYRDARGRIKLGPVWNSDCILGNNFPEPFDPVNIAMQKAPYYDKLTQDMVFLNRLDSRFSELRKRILKDDVVIKMVDDTAAYLWPAQLRDWKRWSAEYNVQPELPPEVLAREKNFTFEREFVKMRYLTIVHSSILGNSMRRMSWKDDLFDSSYNTIFSSISVVIFFILYLLAVRIGRYH